MSQFKPGDLALIVGASHNFDNIGKECELLQIVKQDECYWAPDGTPCQYADTVPAWIVKGDGVTCIFEDGTSTEGWSAIFDAHLMPLKGDFVPEHKKSRELVK